MGTHVFLCFCIKQAEYTRNRKLWAENFVQNQYGSEVKTTPFEFAFTRVSFITTVRFCDGLTMSLVDWLCSGIFKCLHSVGLCSLLAFFGCNASYSRGLHGTDFSVQLPQKICYLLPLPSTKFMFCPAPIHKSPQVKVDFFQYIHEISIKLFQVRPLATTYPSINAPDILFVIKKIYIYKPLLILTENQV